LIWVKQGQGLLKVDFSSYLFEENHFFAFAPYQPFMFSSDAPLAGVAVQFHSDFFCIHRNPKDTNCDEVLFNNVYQAPMMPVNAALATTFELVITQIKEEFQQNPMQDIELLIPYLKILLVTASRYKLQMSNADQVVASEVPFQLAKLKQSIEKEYKSRHTASYYAEVLHISTNALAKLVKSHFHKSLTELITERIITEAKRELYLTHKPVKEIAWDLGFKDEFYFSRVFKNYTEVAPAVFRETVGYGKAEEVISPPP
jgi:AraC-like DNA-binding protein